MIAPDVFRHVPVLLGDGVRLEPLTDAVFDDYLAATADPEVRRLTGSHAFNPRARRVYEKCGFVVEGRMRDVLWWDGAWHDELRTAVLAPVGAGT